MSTAPPGYLWDMTDQQKARAHGWLIETVGTIGHGDQRNFGGIAIDEGLSFGSYLFCWIDPKLMGKTWDDRLVDLIANEAAKGVPLYEKAWTLYCYLDLRGKLKYEIDSWGDDISGGPASH